MENDIQVFIGMLKRNPNLFILGESIRKDENNNFFLLKNVVRIAEVPTQDGRVGYQFHPDPYFTSEKEVKVPKEEFLLHRVEEDSSDKLVRDYKSFMTSMRMQKSGLVAPQKNDLGALHGRS